MNLFKSNKKIQRASRKLDNFFNKFEKLKTMLKQEIENLKLIKETLYLDHQIENMSLLEKQQTETNHMESSLELAERNHKRVSRLLK